MFLNPATSSGRLTADTAIFAAPAILHSVILEGDGVNPATVTIYDNKSAASGTVLATILLPATGIKFEQFLSTAGIVANNGIYMDITGTGAACVVHYTPC